MSPLEKAGYLSHAKTPAFQKKLSDTLEFINKYNDYAVCVSWGKDSVVLLHLACSLFPHVVAINGRYPNPAERIADEDRVRDEFLKLTNFKESNYYEVLTPGEWEMYENEGSGGFLIADTPEKRKWFKWWHSTFDKNMWRATKNASCNGQLWGLCVDESRYRKMCVSKYGKSYERNDGHKIAHPLAYWSAKDIWAYHAINNLPNLRIYDKTLLGRDKARSGFCFAGDLKNNSLSRYGVFNDWQRVYPHEFDAWMTNFPNLTIGLH